MENAEFHTVRGYQLLDQNNKLLTSAMEDYLEMIYRYSITEGFFRVNKLADLLNVKASSATKMVQKLGMLGLLNYEKYGIINLTEDGKYIGKYLLNRHNTIEEFLKIIGNNENIFIETELIEHSINSITLSNMTKLINFFKDNPEVYRNYVGANNVRP